MERGAFVVEINPEPTPVSAAVDAAIPLPVELALRRIEEARARKPSSDSSDPDRPDGSARRIRGAALFSEVQAEFVSEAHEEVRRSKHV